MHRTIVLPDIHTPGHHEGTVKPILKFIKPPTDWVRGFMFIYTKPNGRFNKYFTHVIDGQFIVNEKEYL